MIFGGRGEFSLQFLSKSLLIVRTVRQDTVTDVHRFFMSDRLILMKLEISQKVFEKFHENPSSWSQVVLCGQIDGHTRRG